MFFKVALTSLFALASIASANPLQKRQADAGVAITSLTKNGTATDGAGNVAAAGTLSPFGGIGFGCGINWKEDVSYGGGVQAGSEDFGLGGGFTIEPESIEIGLGIGVNAVNASANIQFSGSTKGTFELVLESSTDIECTPEEKDGKKTIVCRTV